MSSSSENRAASFSRATAGVTPLMLAAKRGDGQVVKSLLKKGADANATSEDGWTALMAASEGGHLAIVKRLLKYGADVNATDEYGWTARMSADLFEQWEVIEFLDSYEAGEQLE